MKTRPTGIKSRHVLVAVASTLLLAACGEGSVQDPVVSAASAVVPGNSSPLITGTPTLQASAASLYVFQPSATDADGDMLTFAVTGLPTWATLDAGTGRISGTPTADDAGESAEIEVSVSDGKVSTPLAPFKLNITNPAPRVVSTPGNAAPSISGTATTSVTAGSAFTFTPTAVDPDTLALVFSISGKPTWASFSTATGKLAGTPSSAQVGNYPNIVITVSDGSRTASLPAFAVQVKAAPNAAPTISGTPATSGAVGSAYSFAPSASDPEKQALGWSIAGKPAWASFNTSTGALTGTPGQGNVGTSSGIVITVSDGANTASLPAFSIQVQATANGAPVIGGQPATTGRTGVSYGFTPTASDPNSDALTFSISGKPSWAAFSTSTGALTGVPTAAGSYNTIVISVTDGKTTTSLAAFSILVSATTTGSATLSWTPPTANTDGSTLNNLAGYRVYYGMSEGAMTQTIQITNPGLTSYTVGNLTPGTYYFSIAAYTADGVEGSSSGVGSKTIL